MTDTAADGLLTLREACDAYGNKFSPRTLRRENTRGRLIIERIGGTDFTTVEHIEEMRKLCRLQPSPRDSGSDHPATGMGSSIAEQRGSSSTEAGRSALAALQATLRAQGVN